MQTICQNVSVNHWVLQILKCLMPKYIQIIINSNKPGDDETKRTAVTYRIIAGTNCSILRVQEMILQTWGSWFPCNTTQYGRTSQQTPV